MKKINGLVLIGLMILISTALVSAVSLQRSPSACNGQWASCSSAFGNDGQQSTVRATNSATPSEVWRNYGFSLSNGSQITNIVVRADFFANKVSGYANVRVSGNGGLTYGPSHIVGGNTVEQIFNIDVTNDFLWTPSMINNGNLKVNVTCFKSPTSGSNPTCRLDWLPITITYNAEFDFSVAASPLSAVISTGESASTVVSANLISGIAQNVDLSASNCPLGAICAFTPAAGMPTYNSQFMVSTSNATPVGTYDIIIFGTGGGKIRSAFFTVIVSNSTSTGNSTVLGITDPTIVVPQPGLGLPPVGSIFTEPAFGTTLKRLADAASGDFDRHVYSQLQAFNNDSSLILMESSAAYRVRNVNTLQTAYTFTEWPYAPRWNPLNGQEIVYFAGGSPVLIKKVNVLTGQITSLNFPLGYQWEPNGRSISFEEISRNGQWMTLFVRNTNTGKMVFLAYDLLTQQIAQELDLANRCGGQPNPNWVAVSPVNGNVVIQWNTNGINSCNGVEVYSRISGQYLGHLASHYDHSDSGIDQFGNEIYVTPDVLGGHLLTVTAYPGSSNFIAGYDKIILDPGVGRISHISCQGPAGICAVTGLDNNILQTEAFDNEIYLVSTSGIASLGNNTGAAVNRLAHHRSTSCGYFNEPQASISRDGSYLVFASDWGDCNSGADSYLINLK